MAEFDEVQGNFVLDILSNKMKPGAQDRLIRLPS